MESYFNYSFHFRFLHPNSPIFTSPVSFKFMTITENHNQSKCRIWEPSPNGYLSRILTPRAQRALNKMRKNDWRRQDKGLCHEIVFFSNVRNFTPAISSISPQHCELNKDEANENAKLYGERPMRPQPYTKNYRQLSKTER